MPLVSTHFQSKSHWMKRPFPLSMQMRAENSFQSGLFDKKAHKKCWSRMCDSYRKFNSQFRGRVQVMGHRWSQFQKQIFRNTERCSESFRKYFKKLKTSSPDTVPCSGDQIFDSNGSYFSFLQIILYFRLVFIWMDMIACVGADNLIIILSLRDESGENEHEVPQKNSLVRMWSCN